MSKKNKELYNYVINTLGISKQMVMEYVTQRLEDILAKHVQAKLDSRHIENMILDKVTQIMEHGVPQSKSVWWTRVDFDTYLKKVIERVLEEKMSKDYNIELKVTQKDNTVTRKV